MYMWKTKNTDWKIKRKTIGAEAKKAASFTGLCSCRTKKHQENILEKKIARITEISIDIHKEQYHRNQQFEENFKLI